MNGWRVLSVFLALLVLLAGSAAQAQVVVLDFSGPRSNGARAEVVEALMKMDAELLPVADAESAAKSHSVSLDSDRGRQEVAAEKGIRAFVGGEVQRDGKRFTLVVTVYSGDTGEAVGEAKVSARRAKLRKRIGARIGRDLGGLLDDTRAPEPREEAAEKDVDMDFDPDDVPRLEGDQAVDEEEVASEDEEDEEPDAAGGKASPLEVGVLLTFLSRDYSYKDSVLTMSNHRFLFNPAPALLLRVYPFAFGDDPGVLGHIGVDFGFKYLLFATAKRDDIEYDTNSSDLRIGLHGRIPMGEHELGLGVGYGLQSTSFGRGADGSDAGVPDVSYGHLRFGAETRLVFGAVSFKPAVALLLPLSYGDLASDTWFPHTTGLGVDTALHMGIGVADGIELLVGGTFRQWGFGLKPEPTDRGVLDYGRAAGGVTDRYFSADLGLMIRL